MESSFAGAPAVTEPPAPAPPAPEPPAPEPAAPATTEGETPTGVEATIADLGQKLDTVLQQITPPEAPPATDLLAALEGEPEVDPQAPVGEPGQPQPGEPGFEDPAAQQQLDELRAFVRKEAQQLVSPIQQERREEQIQGLQTKYPDIVEPKVLEPLERLVTGLSERAGNPNLIFDPQFVEMAYKAVKAEQADAGAVPAEQAATTGASLETHAGHTQAGDPSLQEQYVNALHNSGSGRSEFG